MPPFYRALSTLALDDSVQHFGGEPVILALSDLSLLQGLLLSFCIVGTFLI